MKVIKYNFKNMFKNGSKVGWITPNLRPYSRAMASTRIRCYDVIEYLNENGIKSEIYWPFSKYDTVVFQKAFSRRNINRAKELKRSGVRVYLDINVNYLTQDAVFITDEHRANIVEMLNNVECILVPSESLKSTYSNIHKNVEIIEESIPDSFFKYKKIHEGIEKISLVYCGYVPKANQILVISGVLKELYKKYNITLLFITDKDPEIDVIPYEYVKYKHSILPSQLIKGDIKISPRDLNREYNLGHTFTKIGYPMSVGLPVVASPVPSYKGSPAILCETEDDWYKNLERLIVNPKLRQDIAIEGTKYVKSKFSMDVVGKKYLELFK